jgi:hypothetical protein
MAKKIARKKQDPELKRAVKLFRDRAKEIFARIAEARDDLRNLVGECDSLLESCDDAAQSIEDGLDTLSQYI